MKETLYGTFGPMLQVAGSYFERAYDPDDMIVYRSATGLYAEKTCYTGEEPLKSGGSVWVENAKALQCSEFTMAVCSGIPYGLSRYVQETNERLWWGFKTDGSVPVDYSHRIPGYLPGEDYLTAAEFAHYCFLKGWLIPFDPDHNAMLPGDVLFWTRKTDNYSKVFRNIGHVAVLLDRQETEYTSIESGRTVRRRLDGQPCTLEAIRRTYAEDAPDYTARLPIPVSRYEEERIPLPAFPEEGGGNAPLTVSFGPEGLRTGFYSLNWEQEGGGGAVVRIGGKNAAGEELSVERQLGPGRMKHLTFFADLPVNALTIAGTGPDGACGLRGLTLHTGYVR